MNRRTAALAAIAATAVLAGCASLNNVSSDVSSYGDWPAGRSPGTYAFERLPSQQARSDEIERLENAARPALAKAGFQPVAAGQQPDVLVQLGARTSRTEGVLWDDPIWWRGGIGYWRHGPWLGPGWGTSIHLRDSSRYQREVVVLIRDRATSKPLFEARAANEGISSGDDRLLGAMFEAALMDFPKLGVNPRRVVVQAAP